MVTKEELKRIKQNLKKIEGKFDEIDRQIDESMKISAKTLSIQFDI